MLASLRSGDWLTEDRARIYALMIALFGAASLIFIWVTGGPMTDRFGRPIATDFSGMWTAGRMLVGGDPTGLFDPETHFAFQRQVFANPAIDVYGWHYPPFFLAVAALMGLLPYVPALIAWQASTFALYLAAVRAIAPPHRALLAVAIGFPAVFVTLGHGHNAFLTAGLLGFGLLLLPTRPIIAGICIGLLAYKPQFGLVLPVVMLLGWHVRAVVAAGVTVLAMVAGVTLWLGPEVWTAFLKGAVFTREVILEQGITGWAKIQSTFSAFRSFGAPLPLAYGAQFAVTGLVVAILALAAWRRADHRLVAAMTATGALLATPYCLDYDMTILAVAVAFTAAHGVEKGFGPYEKTLLAAVWLLPLVARPGMMVTGVPIGVLVMALFFGVLAHRALGPDLLRLSARWSPARG
ncbi:glycosyltransferase family 87 protein [Phreatobacter sp.]|uniref:glycosyltransferase family 87 protein n=1 Tax=Phreatobacter sp. TaxID=1966341 RepID=UPI0022BCBCAD|nr:glycosyltransferase family 87 protein [Phreatobacter sp.]MCZ8316480.1 glycosyltransferase family 87 protein [Phreatobacter sp.]